MRGFLVIIGATGILLGIYIYFLLRRVMKFYGLNMKKISLKIVNVLAAAGVVWICTNLRQTAAMAVLHTVVISMLLDIFAGICRRIMARKEETRFRYICRKFYGCGLVPLAITAVLFTYGFWNMRHPVKTEYTVKTEKNIGDYTIALLTDTHYGTIQDTDLLKEKIQEINSLKPDLVILGGDIVEEGTAKEKMREVFQCLGEMESTYGVYYVYGNHDSQPYSANPAYTKTELESAILDSGIIILEDTCVEINGELILAGRADAAWGNASGRASPEELLKDADKEKYIIVADHQPVEAEENAAMGADLELSGHTHAGQMWPIGYFTELTGQLNYGEYQRDGCKVIVSSGFTGWGYPIRTQGHCEYVMVHIGRSAK